MLVENGWGDTCLGIEAGSAFQKESSIILSLSFLLLRALS
tara:strand:+ start:100 stop:219 length:120 start_codon:yes stop_codon:yes gene_type:complete